MSSAIPQSSSQQPIAAAELDRLMDRVVSQDKPAFREFYHLTSPKLLGIIYCIVRDKALAEDILQEIYLKIWQRAADFATGEASPMPGIVALARCRALEEVRKRTHLISSQDVSGFDAIPADMTQPLDENSSEASQWLFSFLGQVESAKQDMIILSYIYGMARDKLALQFDIPLATVKTWLRRGLTDLRNAMMAGHG